MSTEVYQEQGISLSDLLFLIKKNVLMILIITIICTVAGGVYAYKIKKPVYTAIATAVVQAEPTNSGTNEATSYSYSVALTNTFKDIIKNITVINAAVDILINENNYNESDRNILKSKLINNVSVSSTASTLTLTVSATSTKAEEAIALANAILKATVTEVDKPLIGEDGKPVVDSDGNVVRNYIILADKLKVFSQASGETTSIKHNELLILVVTFMVGLVISFGIILVKYFFDDTYTSKDSFERTYNINILASIQNAEGENV